jgi:hypothetical protein
MFITFSNFYDVNCSNNNVSNCIHFYQLNFSVLIQYTLIFYCINVLCIVRDWAASRERIGKHVPNNTHQTIEGNPLLGNRPVNISRSNEYATIGCLFLGNAWVDTPGSTGYPLLSN